MRTKYNCVFCVKGISKSDLWKIDIYPALPSEAMDALLFRCCTGCNGIFFGTLLRDQQHWMGTSDDGMYRHHCLCCNKGIPKPELWTIEAYPSKRNPKFAGEMVRCCETCIERLFALYKKRLAERDARPVELGRGAYASAPLFNLETGARI